MTTEVPDVRQMAKIQAFSRTLQNATDGAARAVWLAAVDIAPRRPEHEIRTWVPQYIPIDPGLMAPHEPYKRQNFPKKSEIRENSTFYVLRDLIDLLMIPREIGR
jgi:hypothetical protein